jgi:hypothetical protein
VKPTVQTQRLLRTGALVTLAFAGAAILGGCRKNDAGDVSDTKTLDNFADGKGVDTKDDASRCGLSLADGAGPINELEALRSKVVVKSGTEPEKRALQDEVLGTLYAVAPGLRSFYFEGLKGTIVLDAANAQVCKELGLTADDKEFVGADVPAVPACWRVQSGKKPELLLVNDAELARHALVRLFGYFLMEAFVDHVDDLKDGDVDGKVLDKLKALKGMRSDLAKAFLADLRAAADAERNKAEAPKPGEPSWVAAYDRFRKFDNESEKQVAKFGNYVFAEAIDSYFCTSLSHQSFEKNFSRTYRAFTTAPDDDKKVSAKALVMGIK